MKKQTGITLISLVITIIVLLILAGVTIATLTGDNGLLTKVGNAKNTANEAEIMEKIKLAYQDYYLGQHTENGYTFQNAVDKMFGTGVATVTESNGLYTIEFTDGEKYTYNVATGKVEKAQNSNYFDSINLNNATVDMSGYDANNCSVFDVIDLMQNSGFDSVNIQGTANFLILNEDNINCYNIIKIYKIIKESIADPWANEIYNVDAKDLTDEQREELNKFMWININCTPKPVDFFINEFSKLGVLTSYETTSSGTIVFYQSIH